MDPIAHTLAGATLAQTGLGKMTPLALATLVIAANLPDIDGVMSFFGSDTSLFYRRGITHGVLAQALLPLLLTGGILAYDRWIRRRLNPSKAPVRAGHILLLSYIGVISHPLLDWLNTYGVRLLMPFSGRWFYGDTLFIIDAWMWLLMAAAVVFAYSQSRLSQALWMALGLATSALITLVDFVPTISKIAWWIGLGMIFLARMRGVSPGKNRGVAVACIACFCLYLAGLTAGNVRVTDKVHVWLQNERGEVIRDLMVGPLPGAPFHREVIAVGTAHYHGLRVPVLGDGPYESLFNPVPIEYPNPIVRRALQNNDVRGFVNWMRFPTYEVKAQEGGYTVIIRDLRYVRPHETEGRGIGIAETFVPLAALDSESNSN